MTDKERLNNAVRDAGKAAEKVYRRLPEFKALSRTPEAKAYWSGDPNNLSRCEAFQSTPEFKAMDVAYTATPEFEALDKAIKERDEFVSELGRKAAWKEGQASLQRFKESAHGRPEELALMELAFEMAWSVYEGMKKSGRV